MPMLTTKEINEIRNSVDIVKIIGEFIPLTKKGRNFFGLCPFHDDHNPSMSVSTEKQIYKCFSCGASGNVINFIMDYEHKSFSEAIIYLADKAGIKITKDIYQPKKQEKHEPLYQIYDIATKYYQNNINTSSGSKAKEYLKKRKIDDEIIKEFQIGLSLNKIDDLTKLLLKKGFTEKELVNGGITNKTDSGFQDVFINRIIFPLWDVTGRVIGYSGRIYTDSDMAKYINTKETDIFRKGMLLYNYHRAKDSTRKEKFVILMEGFMDVIRCYSVGIQNVIAIMGTSITNDQINLIRKLSPNVYLCFDNDDAGQAATLAIGNELEKVGIEPKIIKLSNDLDPDDYIQKYGVKQFKLAIEETISFTDFKLDYYKKGRNLKNNDELTNYINDIIQVISKIDDNIKRELIISKISDEYSISKEVLLERLNKYISRNKFEPKQLKPKTKPESLDKYQKAERQLLYYMLKSKEVIKRYEDDVSYLPTINGRVLANEIIAYTNKYGHINIADFITYLGDKQELIKLVSEIEMFNLKEEYTIDEINDYIKTLNEFSVINEIERLKNLMKNELDIMKKAKYAETIRRLKIEE